MTASTSAGGTGAPTRVLFLIDTLEIGGAELSWLDLLPRLRLVEPVLCHLYPGRALREAYERAGIPVVSLDLPGRYSPLEAVARVRRVVRERRPRVIHSALLRSDLVARAVGALERLPVVNSFLSDGASRRPEPRHGRLLAAKYALVRWLDRHTAGAATVFVANSAAAKRSNCVALGVPEGKVRVIYRGRDGTVFAPPAAGPDSLGGRADGRPAGPRLLCVARLREGKGLADLVHAMPLVIERCPGASLSIVGEGPARAALERLVAERGLRARVSLPGASRDVAGLLREADLFVSASHAEGLPGAVVEAMLSGLPVALSDIEVHREMTDAGAAGALFPAGDSRALAQVVVALHESPREAGRLAALARERALSLFDPAKAAAQHEELYAAVLGLLRERS